MRWLTLVALLLGLALPHLTLAVSDKTNTVLNWAKDLGKDLWKLNKALIDPDAIKAGYKKENAIVGTKNGVEILTSALRSVSTMLNRKIKAVKCIHTKAKKLASEFFSKLDNSTKDVFKYCSAKYSEFSDEKGIINRTEELPRFAQNRSHYLDVYLEKDSHFYEISVAVNQSCVHVPTNIYYLENDTRDAILWTEGLTEVFVNNYKSDPSLAWQYFGTAQGVLRFYPGMMWNQNGVDEYDCRVRTWYIEAATCSKEVVILFDVSGSMTGFKNYVARKTLESILSTLSNNDYVNVFAFGKETENVVTCFEGLVQATRENINTIQNALKPKQIKRKDSDTPLQVQLEYKIPLTGNANLTKAYIKAFDTLKNTRKGKCNVSASQGCNQNVMVITDYVPANLSEVFDEHNRVVENNKTFIPVRVFTFLIGKEVTNVGEIQSMACNNRGYFVHIHSVEEVQQQVLKYINVIARPMVLSDPDPPPTWTHANIDDTRIKWNVSGPNDSRKPDEDKLVASVAIPTYEFGNKNATLLGVAGTDVPIDSIAKLAQPHQLGVNGYPIIVSNNGYLLLHPLLIATINGKLQDNFNSVDFVEVEQVDDGKDSRELGPCIIHLRECLVNGTDGTDGTDCTTNAGVNVLYHYDNMRRIARVKHDFFIRGLNDTPFSMGISLPAGYGVTELNIPTQSLKWVYLKNESLTEYFRHNFRVHPDWVYCKYHYLEGHETLNAEMEIWNFLTMLSNNALDIDKQQYADEDENPWTSEMLDEQFESLCGANRSQVPDKDEYYCTKDLVNKLVFDAKVTHPFFDKWNPTEKERNTAAEYNVNVRFIATSNGLTKWHYIFDTDKNEYVYDNGTREKKYTDEVFGDKYHNAIEETWYKAAVLQHMVQVDTLVIATALPVLDETINDRPEVIDEAGNITITASLAIFYRDKNDETPAAVSGFQFLKSGFYTKFKQIISSDTKNTDKNFICNEGYSCYLVDSSGYVVLAEDDTHVGKFFGVVDNNTKYVMQKFIETEVFDHVEVFNYQALCKVKSPPPPLPKSSWSLKTPFSVIGSLIRWLITEVTLLAFNWNQYTYAEPLPETTTASSGNDENKTKAVEEEPDFSCDHRITLYILNKTAYNKGWTSSQEEATNCSPAYWAARVSYTNLLLVVVSGGADDFQPNATNCKEPRSTEPVPTQNSTWQSEPCHKLDLGTLYRRPLAGCYTYNETENDIKLCGRGGSFHSDLPLLLTAAVVASLASALLSS